VRRVFTILAGIVAVVIAVTLASTILFERRLNREIDTVLAGARRPVPVGITTQEIARLPAPVQRWLSYANVLGTQVPATVRLRQNGEFRMEGAGWMPFSAEQYFTIDPPGFLWKATFRMAPLILVKGRDQYRSGEGSIHMRVLSLVPVANKTGGGLNQGALLRFLGEMQWFPAAALAPYVVWNAVDDESVRATMTYGGISASMMFRFDANGRLAGSWATRYNDARGRNESWVNRNDSDQFFSGIRVPAAGEARWDYDTGAFPYIRWRITTIEHDRSARFDR
jgi:hypothetical protein